MKHSGKASLVVSAALFVLPSIALGAGPEDLPIGRGARAQVAALLEEKESRTPAQRKIDSNILYEMRLRRGEKVAEGLATLETGLSVDSDGLVAVEIRAHVTDSFLKGLAARSAAIFDVSKAYRTVAARVPVSEIEALAEMSEVVFIQPYFPPNFWHDRVSSPDDRPGAPTRPPLEERARRVRDFVEDVVRPAWIPQVGGKDSQGDATHEASTARSTIGPSGSGIKIGVISNGVVSLAASQALGDLPANVTVLTGQTGTGDEGTAMLEIVHDLAPDAQLFFATAGPTIARFAQNVRDLRAAGCDIIIDDVFYFVETPFQDGQAPSVVSNTNGGIVTQAVRDVVASGAMYFSSAGNQGNLDDNTSSCYQGDWADGGVLAGANGGTVHDFGGGAQSNLIQTGSGNPINLYWADPLGAAANDYDLFVFNNALTAVVGFSTNVQSGTQDPFEQSAGNTTNNRVVVLKKTAAAARFFHITINANGLGRLGTATEGTTKGHSAAAGAFSVAATPAAAPGPFPSPHSAANVSETFSSDGPRRIFFDADGTAFTPGDFSSTGGLLRPKPDITAADRVSVTGVGGFPTTFAGTSAAAPHAGAIAALLKSGLPAPTNAAVATALRTTAIDIEAAGTDRDTGAGIVMPLPAMAALGMVAQAALEMGTFTVAELIFSSDGDGAVEKGETGTLVISNLANNGPVGATSVTATLSSTTAGVTILPPASLPYPNIGAGGTPSNATPYQFQLGPAYSCGSPIDFALTVAYDDGSARSKVFTFTATLATGFTVSTQLDATAPPANPKYTAVTGTQTNRLFRDSHPGTCSLPKSFPGPSAATNPRFDAYTFTATSSGCNAVTLNGGPLVAGSSQLFTVVYSGTFDPASINTNYLADSGSSPASNGTTSFSFNATAGQSYVVVVAEVPGTSSSPPYRLTVTGAPLTVCDFTPQADLSITKTDGVAIVTAGGNVTYTITATNNGPITAAGATVADAFPAALTAANWTCVGSGGGTCTAGGAGSINDTVNLPVGGSVTYTVNASISLAATGTLANSATVTAPGAVTDPTLGNNSATDMDTITAAPTADLAVTKTDGQSFYHPGQTLVYTIVASNAGPSAVTGATVADTLPADVTSASWTCVAGAGSACGAPNGSGSINTSVDLLSGGNATFTLTATVSPTAVVSLSNTATVAAPGGVLDPTPANNSATDTDTRQGGSYHTVTPCRVLDTRNPGGPYGGPPLAAGTSRTFTIAGQCGIPANATAIQVNLAVTDPTAIGYVTAYPTGSAVPLVATVNYRAGQTRANNAIVPLSGAGEIDLRCAPTGTVNVIVDVSGYFVE
jgi:uncharacterized repeat protein (TIGR01451 family)